jgi:hypothetical protein
MMSELLVSLKARRKAARGYVYNTDMGIEANLLDAQIKAIEKRAVTIKVFKALLKEFEECTISKANSGGGHPEDIPLKEADYEEAKAELLNYLNALL